VDVSRSSRRIRVVVADDIPDMRLLLRMAMADRDDVELLGEAANGEEAVALAAALRPELLVLDLKMPVLDGIAALPRLRTVAPQTRVVILSALSADQHRDVALGAGAAAYVEKGVRVTDLVDELLRGASLLDTVLTTLTQSLTTRLARSTSSPGEARRFITAALGSWQESHLVDTVQLLLSELVTNVLMHASGEPDVRVSLFPDHVHVEVVDSDPAQAVVRVASPDATSGRGLQLVDALASAWGTAPLAHGKVVWFDVSRSAGVPAKDEALGW
jgi:DNA-binding NarL/FixJ family response regulator